MPFPNVNAKLTSDSSKETCKSVKITLASATVFSVVLPDYSRGFYVVTSLTDLRFSVNENPEAINATAETVSPVVVSDMRIGNDLASLQTRILAEGINREVRFFSQTGGDIILNIFG